EEMLQPYRDSGQVQFFTHYVPVEAKLDGSGQRLIGLRFRELGDQGREDLLINAALTIDASDWGDVIQVAGADFECGPDPQSRYREPSAPSDLSKFPANEM